MVRLIKDVMTKEVVTVESSCTILKAAQIMSKMSIGGLPVIEDGQASGIVTERDVLQKVVANNLDPSKVLVRDFMSKSLITARPNDTIEEAARLMVKNRIRRLPIVEGLKLVGIITSADLVKHLRNRSLSTINSLGSAPEVFEDKRYCQHFEPDHQLKPEQVWKICGACNWYMYGHCIHESVEFLKNLPTG